MANYVLMHKRHTYNICNISVAHDVVTVLQGIFFLNMHIMYSRI